MFAVKSAVKLGQQARTAYVDATRARALTLPLPNFFSQTTAQDAVSFFSDPSRGKAYMTASVEIKTLVKRFKDGTITTEESETLLTAHVEYANLRRAERGEAVWEGGVHVDPKQLNALLTVRQWRRGADPNPTALQRVAGTLIEIGIDYAQTQPELFDESTPRGRALKGFFEGLDDFDFVNTDLSEFPARLFMTAMEAVSEEPALLTGDPKVQDLVRATTSGLSQKVGAKIEAIEKLDLDPIAKRAAFANVEEWGQLVFRTTLSSAAELALSDPGRYFGVEGAGEKALVSEVGGAFLDLVLDEKSGGLAAAFSRDGLETVLDAALVVVGKHPEILVDSKNAGVTKLVSQLASDLEELDLLEGGLLPEVGRLVLLRSGENLGLLWPKLKTSPEKNLLLVAAQKTLEVASRPAADGERWAPPFGKSELLEITEVAIGELAENPGWLITSAGNVSSTLGNVVEAAVGVLRRHGDVRLTPTVGAEIVRAAIAASGLRKEFTSKLPSGAGERAGEILLDAALDIVIGTIFGEELDAKAAWQLARGELVAILVAEVLEALARHDLDASAIGKLESLLEAEVARLAKGAAFEIEEFIAQLEMELAEAA